LSEVLPGIRDALEAMNRGDVESAVSLLDPEVEWRGPTRGYVWWRHAPSCHGLDQAGENFELQVTKATGGPERPLSGLSRPSRSARRA
jgi:ketosteroid isomerase-like protein